MLRSELQPKPFSVLDVFAIIGVATMVLIATLSIVWIVAAHTWRDDSRATKLRELEKAHVAAPVEPPVSLSLLAYQNDLFVPPPRTDHNLMIMNPDTNANIVIDDAGHELVRYSRTVHHRPHVNQTIRVDLEVTLDGAKSFSAEVAKDIALCSKEWCAKTDECYSAVIYDSANHVELALPCVDGHVGTWVMTKLP